MATCVNPNDFLNNSIEMIQDLVETTPHLGKPLSIYASKIKAVRDLKVSDVKPAGLVNTTKASNAEFLRKYKIRKSVGFDKSIGKMLQKQSMASQHGGGVLRSLYGFGSGFKYKGVFSSRTSGVYLAWNGFIRTIMLVAWSGGTIFASMSAILAYFQKSKPKDCLREIIRAERSPIRDFARIALMVGLTGKPDVIAMMDGCDISVKSMKVLDKYITRLVLAKHRYGDIQAIIALLLCAYLHRCRMINISPEFFQKCIYMCLGFGVNSGIVAAREAFEMKYTMEHLLKDVCHQPSISSTQYVLVLASVCDALASIRAKWYTRMPEENKSSFDYIENFFATSKRVMNENIMTRANNEFKTRAFLKF